jgi:hypothetical protein
MTSVGLINVALVEKVVGDRTKDGAGHETTTVIVATTLELYAEAKGFPG